MRLTRVFPQVRFGPDMLRRASDALHEVTSRPVQTSVHRIIGVEGEWHFDGLDEFLGELRRSGTAGYLVCFLAHETAAGTFVSNQINVEYDPDHSESRVTVEAPTREIVYRLMEAFETQVDPARLPAPTKMVPTIFIGHGRSTEWKDLKDHLVEQHDYDVQAFEIGARAGHTVRDILDELLERSTFAIIVMTGEDELGDGGVRARQNVVHEAGLFQGRLGFTRVICAVEEGCERFSNIDGIIELRFARGHIKEIFGDVVATLRREFGPR